MCRLYGFRATEPTKVECTLVHAQNALMVQSRRDLAGHTHWHGWGLATYEDHHPRIERQAWAAYHGEHFRRVAGRIYSKTVLGHVRHATVGAPAIENTHPFSDGPWSFVHNGTVASFDRLRVSMRACMAPNHRAAIAGDTDSEHVFRFLLSLIDRHPSRPLLETFRAGLAQIVGWCWALDPEAKIGLNVILTDGERMVGSRWGRTLHHIERDGIHECEICGFPHVHHDPKQHYRALDVASEPITHEAWTEIPDRSVYEVTEALTLHVEPLAPKRGGLSEAPDSRPDAVSRTAP